MKLIVDNEGDVTNFTINAIQGNPPDSLTSKHLEEKQRMAELLNQLRASRIEYNDSLVIMETDLQVDKKKIDEFQKAVQVKFIYFHSHTLMVDSFIKGDQ